MTTHQRATQRESLITQTFLHLADSLADQFDLTKQLEIYTQRCVELFQFDAAGIVMHDIDQSLRVVASSYEDARLLQLFQLQCNEGPSVDAYSTGWAVTAGRLQTATSRWSQFVPYAIDRGYEGAYCFPMRWHGSVIGTLSLFERTAGRLPEVDLDLAQTLADFGGIAMMQATATRSAKEREGQLERALKSRIVIEQAKGMLSSYCEIDMETAFRLLRSRARNTNTQLATVAAQIVFGEIAMEQFCTPAMTHGH
jgi:GAF domain-containing protein